MKKQELAVIEKALKKFTKEVFQKGLSTIIHARWGGMSGVFGNVMLRSFTTKVGGDVLFTFAESQGEVESSVSCTITKDELKIHESTISCEAVTAKRMIGQVIRLWPTNKQLQQGVYRWDDELTKSIMAPCVM